MKPRKKNRKKENCIKRMFSSIKSFHFILKNLPKNLAHDLYIALYHLMGALCEHLEYGDPFSYARSKEIYMACKLGHDVAKTYSGEDASNIVNDEMEKYEYKSTTPGPKSKQEIKGTYSGVSVFPTWEEQEKYLRVEKIGCYKWHFYGRFEGSKLVEVWRVRGEKVLEILLPKFEKSYPDALGKKDPRLSATITKKEIYKHGEKVEI